ncbi:MAG TPA: hypothetical protein VGV92_00385 [Gammaproteobacteria bacterium]|nr:hypothetical protein [Gammaproteobacteria bacterium]
MDERTRIGIIGLIKEKKYSDALLMSDDIKHKNADDCRRMAECKYGVGCQRMEKKLFQGAIELFTSAILCIVDVKLKKEKETEQDTHDIRRFLPALLNAMNAFFKSSPTPEWSKAFGTLETFLKFYVSTLPEFNEKEGRLPGLDELELQFLTPLFKSAPTELHRERLKFYVGIISLFHSGMKEPEKDLKNVSDDRIVKIAFKLYQRALEVLRTTAAFVRPLEEEEVVPSVVVQPPVVVPLPTEVQVLKPTKKKVRFSDEEEQPKASKLHTWEYIAPDEPKRVLMRQWIAAKTLDRYIKVLKGLKKIMNQTTEDYRFERECHYRIGLDHCGKNRLQEAMECFKQAFTACTHLRDEKDIKVIELDTQNIASIFKIFVAVVNEVIKGFSENVESASKCMMDFLNVYLDCFWLLNGDKEKPLGLDGINMEPLIAFLNAVGDETPKETVRIYLAVIGMFRQDAKLEEGGLVSVIEEIKIKKKIWRNDASMSDAFDLFEKALELVQRLKNHPVLNPELRAAVESEQKRQKKRYGDSSSSSSLPPYGLEVRSASPPRQDRPVLPQGSLRFSSK